MTYMVYFSIIIVVYFSITIYTPFISKDAADKLARMIKYMYNIDVKQSRIQIR